MYNYQYFGVMLDVSRNAVMKVEEVERFIDHLAKMGYNCLELYAEDTYKIEGEPFFGYMRGGYSKEEIRRMDKYAQSRGVELIPCVQTLAHFGTLMKLPKYQEVRDVSDILLIDEPKTYELIEKIFKTLAECFSSRNVNIGMDEAHMVGLGKYLDQHGYTDRFMLMTKHLNKVVEIAEKYGFTCHMWSDMFFRLQKQGEYRVMNSKIPQKIIDNLPEKIELVYWDYYSEDIAMYDSMFDSHEDCKREIWFGGGAWSWRGFAPVNGFSMLTMKPAIESVIKHGIDKVFLTMWGDNGKECSFYSLLPSLYAIRQYADGNFDEESIKKGFYDTFGVEYDLFMLLDLPNSIFDTDKPTASSAAKSILYSDPFMGRIEKDLQTLGTVDYNEVEKKLKKAAKKAGEYAYLFQSLALLCSVLAIKTRLGVRTREAYKAGDKKTLKSICKEYDLCKTRLKAFYRSFKSLWMKENKAFGWEVQDARLGGLMMRLQSCKESILAYARGEIGQIDELEEEVLNYYEKDFLVCNDYAALMTTGYL